MSLSPETTKLLKDLRDISKINTSKQIQRATAAVAIAETLAPGAEWQLHEIRVHLSAAGAAGDMTATIDSGVNAAYDILLMTQDMSAIVDMVWQPDAPMLFGADDELDIAWANANTKTYGLEIVYSV